MFRLQRFNGNSIYSFSGLDVANSSNWSVSFNQDFGSVTFYPADPNLVDTDPSENVK